MKKYLCLFLILFVTINITVKAQKEIRLTPEEAEIIFLEQNLELIAEKLNISLADARVAQAKVWDNPSLSFSDLNLWTPSSETQSTQFSIELSQLIQTANKRGKLVYMEKISKNITIKQFEEILRALKSEFRTSINEIIYLGMYQSVLDKQLESFNQLIASYTKLVSQGNLAKSELLRLQAALFEIENEWNDIQIEQNTQQKRMKTLLNADPFTRIEIVNTDRQPYIPDQFSLSELMDMAENIRPDLQQARLQTQYYDKSLSYEKSMRIPDLTFSVNYDRYGGVWKDFVGFGISVDLPLLNRNKGNIKAAQINREQSEYLALQKYNQIQYEIVEALNNYMLVYNFYQKIISNSLFGELDDMLEVYVRNLLNRNISMVEYLDFMDTYKSNKNTFLSTQKNIYNSLEELQFIVGTDIK